MRMLIVTVFTEVWTLYVEPVWLKYGYIQNIVLSVGDTLLSMICWRTVFWFLNTFHCISMPFWYVGCYFTIQNYLCIHKVCLSSHTNTHLGSVHLCLYCSYKNLVGIMFADKHKNSGIPKKLHRTTQRSTERLCEKLIRWKKLKNAALSCLCH